MSTPAVAVTHQGGTTIFRDFTRATEYIETATGGVTSVHQDGERVTVTGPRCTITVLAL